MTKAKEALETLIQYGKWQINEGLPHHPTLPSAISSAEQALASLTPQAVEPKEDAEAALDWICANEIANKSKHWPEFKKRADTIRQHLRGTK